MLEAAAISPAWIYAYQHTGGLLPRPDGSFASERDSAEWDEAVGRYMKLHQPGDQVDHEAETRKLQNVLVGAALRMAADDPGYGASLAAQMTALDVQASDAAVLRRYLRAWAGELSNTLRNNPAIRSAACEYARAWAGHVAVLPGWPVRRGQAVPFLRSRRGSGGGPRRCRNGVRPADRAAGGHRRGGPSCRLPPRRAR